MFNYKIIYNNINNLNENLKKRKFKLKKNFFLKILFIKNKLIKFINNNNKKKNFLKKNTKNIKYIIEILFLNKIIKLYKNYLKIISKKLKKFIEKLPNLIHYTVPIGKNSSENILIKKIGKIKKFRFPIKNHIELGEKFGLDFKLGNEISGFGFTIIKPPISYLYKAIIRFMIDIHIKEHNYKEIQVPYIVNYNTAIGSGQLPKFEKKLFKIKNKNYNQYLISTSEIPLVNTLKNYNLESSLLPLKLVCQSTCFRKESKSYGKINKGLIRQYQFDKIELIQASEIKNSYRYLNETIKHAEKLLVKLKIPYRIVLLCSEKTGITSSKTYDIEVWLPSIKNYCEISSCSNTENYQSIRINAKYKYKNKLNFLHILNGSGLAVGRTLVAIIENYQNKNKKIKIPKVLKKYINNKKYL